MGMSKGWKFEGNERKYVDETLAGGFTASASGTMNEKLEQEFAKKHNKKFAITANSGTSTLHMALYAFGVKPGDEVIIPALTVGMCGFAVWQAGAIPVYADVRQDTFLMDPLDVEKKITKKTKAIMPVHIYGLMCDMTSIMDIAKRHNIFVVEDCAQCFLAKDEKGHLSGTVGDVGSWSFENSKHMSTGDGGIVATDNEDFAKKMRQFGGVGFKNLTATSGKVRISRDLFQDPNWERHNIMAFNYRLPEICAAVGLAQLEKLDKFVELRKKMGLKTWMIILFSSSVTALLISPAFKFERITNLSMAGVDILTQKINPANAWLTVGIAVFSALIIYLLSLKIRSQIELVCMITASAFFGYYLYNFFMNLVYYYIISILALLKGMSHFFIVIFLFLFLMITMVFYVGGFIIFAAEVIKSYFSF